MAEATRTPATLDEAKGFFTSALSIQGVKDPAATLLLVAHSALETRQWKAMYQWNWGNITTQSPDESKFFVLEQTPGYKYQVYPSPLSGAVAMVWLIKNRYPGAWKALLVGNDADYVHQLSLGNYFEADKIQGGEQTYFKGVNALYTQFGGISASGPDSVNWWAWSLVGGVLVLGLTANWPLKGKRHAF